MVQAERIRRQRISGDRRVSLEGRRVTITVDKVLPALGKMLRNKANGLADCLVTEMLQCLPTETVYVGSTSGSKENAVPLRRGSFYALCSSKRAKPQARKGPSGVPGDRTPECSLNDFRLFWWICYTRRRSRLNGGGCMWEPREE